MVPAVTVSVGAAVQDWPCANKYGCVLRTQGHRREIIEGLHEESVNRSGVREYSGIVRKLLFEFYTVCRQKPDRLIFFRDGVSEGQFYQVRTRPTRGGSLAPSGLGIQKEVHSCQVRALLYRESPFFQVSTIPPRGRPILPG